MAKLGASGRSLAKPDVSVRQGFFYYQLIARTFYVSYFRKIQFQKGGLRALPLPPRIWIRH